MRSIFRAVLALALALAGGGAFAQVSASDSGFDRFYAQVTGVGKQTISYGSGGQVVVSQGVPQISSSGGPVHVDRSVPLLNNSGGRLETNARIAIPPAVLGKIVRRGLELVPLLGIGVALYDVAKEVGFDVSASPAGPVVTKPLPGFDGKEWRWEGDPTFRITKQAACDVLAGVLGEATKPIQSGGIWYCIRSNNTGGLYRLYDRVAQTTPQPLPSTLSELEAAIASQSGWPSTSKISQAVADATALQPAPAIQAVPQVTGPATSPGETKTKVNPDGSTTTTTTTHNHTYTGPTVNTTTTTVTSTCNGGSCNTTTETETPKLDEQPFSMPCGVPGTPPCAVKVDETGVPDATNVNADRLRDLEEQNADWIEGLVAANPFPDINWAFELPTACGVIPTPAFAPAVDGIDVCQFQPMFHELMTVVWMLGGLFGAISLFMRNALTT